MGLELSATDGVVHIVSVGLFMGFDDNSKNNRLIIEFYLIYLYLNFDLTSIQVTFMTTFTTLATFPLYKPPGI